MKKTLAIFSFLLLIPFLVPASEAPPKLVHGIVLKVRQNIDAEREYGYYQNVTVRKLDGDDRITQQELRTYRTTWIEGHPFTELVSVNNKPPRIEDRTKESKRRSDFIKSLRSKSQSSGMYQELQLIQWEQLYQGYQFQLENSDSSGLSVVSFRPSADLNDCTRFEKVLHKLEGTLWLDPDQNVVRATARLTEPVRFGWGIFAKVDEVEIQFQQQKHSSNWAPAQLVLRFKARIALLKTTRQEITVNWFHPFPRPFSLQTAENLRPGQQTPASQR